MAAPGSEHILNACVSLLLFFITTIIIHITIVVISIITIGILLVIGTIAVAMHSLPLSSIITGTGVLTVTTSIISVPGIGCFVG